jgi:hypothetical protein
VTVGYLDSSALSLIMMPGDAGTNGAKVWDALDSACTHVLSEIEVPSEIGRDLNRFSWVWAVNLLATVSMTDEIQAAAIDLAWLGAPASVAIHVATAEQVRVDHFLTGDGVSQSWAQLRGLNTIRL